MENRIIKPVLTLYTFQSYIEVSKILITISRTAYTFCYDWVLRIGFINHKHCKFISDFYCTAGDRGGTVVKVLCYKSEGRWFDPS